MIDGIILINKEKDITSYDVIRKLKKILPKKQKIGHAGTLDPFATGLLIVLLGKYTKKMNSILQMEKEYIVKAEFGYDTDTQDITGNKIHTPKEISDIKKEDIESRIKQDFLGKILQTPPIFSAKKINGKKAYEYARKGIEIEIKAKEIEIYDFEIQKYEWPFITFRIKCSSGTYVRTLINDLGIKLGTFATAIELERAKIGDFDIEESLNSKDIDNNLDINSVIIKDE